MPDHSYFSKYLFGAQLKHFQKKGNTQPNVNSPLPPQTFQWLKHVLFSGFSFKTKPLSSEAFPTYHRQPLNQQFLDATKAQFRGKKKIVFTEIQLKRQVSVHSVQAKVFGPFQAQIIFLLTKIYTHTLHTGIHTNSNVPFTVPVIPVGVIASQVCRVLHSLYYGGM